MSSVFQVYFVFIQLHFSAFHKIKRLYLSFQQLQWYWNFKISYQREKVERKCCLPAPELCIASSVVV